MPLPEDENEWKNLMVIFATAKGNVRKNSLEDFININNSGKIAMLYYRYYLYSRNLLKNFF